ncbi:unnamed protein product, partial [Ilex paraguariensis]
MVENEGCFGVFGAWVYDFAKEGPEIAKELGKIASLPLPLQHPLVATLSSGDLFFCEMADFSELFVELTTIGILQNQ